MCREIESACNGSGRVCVFRERERERDGKCVQGEGRCFEIERERGSVCSDRERVC